MNIPEKIILNNPLNWILSWNEWITQFLNRYLPFLMISPLFCLFWTLFGQFLGTFPIRPVLIIPWLLNWIIFWIESPEFILNWIIFWIESWVKQYWIEYWMNHFLAKFKHWIESDRVSNTPSFQRSLVTCYWSTPWIIIMRYVLFGLQCNIWIIDVPFYISGIYFGVIDGINISNIWCYICPIIACVKYRVFKFSNSFFEIICHPP